LPLHASRPQYKIELRIRNHTTLDRPTILKELAAAVPAGHSVDLSDPEVFILVEVFKVRPRSYQHMKGPRTERQFEQSVCGVSVVRDYYKLAKFNVIELAQASTHASGNGSTKAQDGGAQVAVVEGGEIQA
jgi:tRNA acetyltransferase TAN1